MKDSERLVHCIPHKDKLNRMCVNTTYSNYRESLPLFIYPLSAQEDLFKILWLFASL